MATPASLGKSLKQSNVSVAAPTSGRRLSTQPTLAAAQLTLTADRLLCASREATAVPLRVEYQLEDLVGVTLSKLPAPASSFGCQLDVHWYPLKRTGKKTSRKMEVLSVVFDEAETFADNMAAASEWKNAIKLQSRRRVVKAYQHGNCSAEVSEASMLVPRHLLVFINPVGGQGKSEAEFTQHVKPLFDLAEINCNIIVTERQNHAFDMMKQYDLSTIDGIAIASGDGLLYEVINGLMEREDWEEAVKTPIGMLPTGSGNALCASTLHESGEEFSLLNAAFQIIRGGIMPMDIATVETMDRKPVYMTLLGSWGMVADIDIESEKLRKIGETRFLLGALNCIRKKKIYHGRLTYLPYDEQDAVSPVSQSMPTEHNVPIPSAQRDVVATSFNPQLLSRAMRTGGEGGSGEREGGGVGSVEEESESQDVFGSGGDVLLEESSIGPTMIGGGMLGGGGGGGGEREMLEESSSSLNMTEGREGERKGVTEEASGGEKREGESKKGKEVADEGDESWEHIPPAKPDKEPEKPAPAEATAVSKPVDSAPWPIQPAVHSTPRSSFRSSVPSSGPDPHLLPELKDSTPESWKTVEGEFMSITLLMVSHMSRGFVGDPKMSIGTGRIRIMYIQNLSRFGMLGMLAGGETGKHLEMSEVKMVDVKAFRLEPYTERGLITVDGEVVKYGPIQAQVHQHLARVFCLKKVEDKI